ncbi:JmjC domain-containing histone demethylation protein 1, partial [Ascosphaera aggregata]
MAGSHSKGGHQNLRRPLRYRTPSPPRDAVEPISPANPTALSGFFLHHVSPGAVDDHIIHWNGDNGSRSPFNVDGSPWQPLFLSKGDGARASSATPSHSGTQQQQQHQHHQHHHNQQQQQQPLSTHSRHTSMSNIDALATIALATSPTFTALALDERASPDESPRFRNASMPPPATVNGSTYSNISSNISPLAADSDERPCKRPRSDGDTTVVGVSNDCELTAATGSTFDSSMKTDAELLLNLARPNTTPLQSSITKSIPSPSQQLADPAIGENENLSNPSRLDFDVSSFTTSNNTQRRNTDQTHTHNLKSDLSLSADANATEDGLNDISYSKHARPAINPHKVDPSESSLVQGHERQSGPSGELKSHPSALAFGHDHKSIHIQNHQNPNFINDNITHNNPDRSNKINPVNKTTHNHNTRTSGTFSADIQAGRKLESPATSKSRRRRQRQSAAPPPIQDIVYEADKSMEQQAKCAACKLWRNSTHKPSEQDDVTWISCDGCNQWFHIVCAGFKNNREIRTVDKFICDTCRPSHGQTTFVRKSSRARTSIDYAGLNQGLIMAAKDTVDHHYIQPIKEGKIPFLPDNFARLKPELITAEYFEHGSGMTEPIVIPAASNPRTPLSESKSDFSCKENDETPSDEAPSDEAANQPRPDRSDNGGEAKSEPLKESGTHSEEIYDCGQDRLGMVIPEGLTVRRIEKLYGPDEPVEVIDVKSQQGEDKQWTMGKWANYYYEQAPNKPVRNVISLEVSQTPLGRLIRRPKIVREFDLQDSVWPEESKAIGDYPHVQLYCLMSVKDSYTDFHIDFGGSSVYYHIIQGKKTFFFIPPREKHLKKYEEWCNSAAQDTTFLGLQTEECYRVDLSAGDTMLIPSGWIHAVWTPEDSLVIGGNFLTRMSYGMQIKVSKIEKDTHVPRKFRYPHFQKIMWYTALKYLEDDPIPQHILHNFMNDDDYQFPRKYPIFHEFGPNRREDDKPGSDYYNVRYYSQPEVDGLQDLARYLFRTALIAAGYQVDGITSEARNAVKKSIPRCPWEPMEAIRRFGFWVAWKRGNEPAPQWTKSNAFNTLAKVDTTLKKVFKPGRKAQRNTSSSSSSDDIAAPSTGVPESQPIAPEIEVPLP